MFCFKTMVKLAHYKTDETLVILLYRDLQFLEAYLNNITFNQFPCSLISRTFFVKKNIPISALLAVKWMIFVEKYTSCFITIYLFYANLVLFLYLRLTYSFSQELCKIWKKVYLKMNSPKCNTIIKMARPEYVQNLMDNRNNVLLKWNIKLLKLIVQLHF